LYHTYVIKPGTHVNFNFKMDDVAVLLCADIIIWLPHKKCTINNSHTNGMGAGDVMTRIGDSVMAACRLLGYLKLLSLVP